MADQDGKSITWVIVVSMLVVAWAGWASLASAYARNQELTAAASGEELDETMPRLTRRRAGARGLGFFVAATAYWIINGFKQLPNIVPVFQFAFAERLWLIELFGCFEIGILVLGLKMKSLEASFADSVDYDGMPRRRKKKKRKKQQPPQPF